MFTYAIIDSDNLCVGISQLSEEVNQTDMIEIPTYNDDYIFRKYENGQWSAEKFEPTPSEPPLSPMDMLGMVTTQNSLELSELKQQVEAIGQGVVEIMLNQQLGGM